MSEAQVATALEFTGERYVPGVEGDIELEHLHRYMLAAELAAGKVVLDLASGEGYGTALLARSAARVFGVDISPEAIGHARAVYRKPNVEFLVGSCAAIPLPDRSVDLVVSFETIEHHDQHAEMMAEIKRVLKDDGVLVISSPDKYHYSEAVGFNNAYHVHELHGDEFVELVGRFFANARYFAQRIVYGSVIFCAASPARQVAYRRDEAAITSDAGLPAPLFWIALATNGVLPELPVGLFEQPIEQAELVRWQDKELTAAIELARTRDEHLAAAAEQLRLKEEHMAVAVGQLAEAMELLRLKDEHLATAAELLRLKDEHLATAAELLRLKDEHLATAAELIRERDEVLAKFRFLRAILRWRPWKSR